MLLQNQRMSNIISNLNITNKTKLIKEKKEDSTGTQDRRRMGGEEEGMDIHKWSYQFSEVLFLFCILTLSQVIPCNQGNVEKSRGRNKKKKNNRR